MMFGHCKLYCTTEGWSFYLLEPEPEAALTGDAEYRRRRTDDVGVQQVHQADSLRASSSVLSEAVKHAHDVVLQAASSHACASDKCRSADGTRQLLQEQ